MCLITISLIRKAQPQIETLNILFPDQKNIELTSSGPSSSRSSFSSKENSLFSFFINCSLVSLSSMRISGLNFGSGIDEVLGVSSVFIGHSFLTS